MYYNVIVVTGFVTEKIRGMGDAEREGPGGFMRNFKIITTVIVMLALILTMGVGCAKKEKPAPVSTETTPAAVQYTGEVYFFPYTGMPTVDKEVIMRRPLSVKIENSKAAMMQEGINSADVVYETQVEGNYTRFNCIFQSNIPDEVGPVRSARLSDLWIVPQYNGLFFFSGANWQVNEKIAEAKLSNMSQDVASKPYHRVSIKRAPHNLYLDLSSAYDYAKDEKNYEITSSAIVPLEYDQAKQDAEREKLIATLSATTAPGVSEGAAGLEELPADTTVTALESPGTASGTTASAASGPAVTGTSGAGVSDSAITAANVISWAIGRSNSARWEWNPDQQRYLRWSLGEEHQDSATDEQVYTSNLVVIYAKFTQQSVRDPAGNPTYDTELGDTTGSAIIFKDGTEIDGTWEADRNSPPKFKDEQGNPIPLNPGKTWFTVFRESIKVTVE